MIETGFLDRATADLKYCVYVPRYSDPKGMPCILFMHGSGECGTDGIRQTALGLPSAIRFGVERWPFVVIMPQKPKSSLLWRDLREPLNTILRDVEQEFQPDPNRRYITGLSQGGFGTFDLAAHLDWQFAAAAPICGRAILEDAVRDFMTIPIWAFHGALDEVVPYESAQKAIQMLKDKGADATFTLYPDADHNSWDRAYGQSDLPNWFLKHRLG